MSMVGEYQVGWRVIEQPLDQRVAFIRRTYLHVAAAIAAFTLFSAAFQELGVGLAVLKFIAGAPMGWLLFLGGFSVAGYVGTSMARSNSGIGMQYAGLGFYTLAEALLFSPMITIAARLFPGVLPMAAGITLLTFGALSGYVLLTKQDFSFMRTGLAVGGVVALVLIVASLAFGFQLGIWFSGAMIVFACGAILYSTSKVLHNYRTDQHVAAALELFAAVALLFWYVLRLLMRLRR